MLRVSVIVVSYKTRELLRAALTALKSEAVHEIIVVDNASQDGSTEMVEREFQEVQLIKNSRNKGFGAANNQGISAMTGDVALLLNSDARPKPGAIAKLASVFEDESVVAAGGRLLHPDGTLQQSACSRLTLWAVFCEQFWLEKLFPNSKFFSPYWQSARLIPKGGGPHEVSQVMGACLMFRPITSFDERFFLYCEDTELCARLATRGKILYVPEAEFTHELGASTSENRWWSIAMYNRGKELYFRFRKGRIAQCACWSMNRKGAFFRMLSYGLMFKKMQVRLWWKVLTAPIKGPQLPHDA
ncbi:MAG: glycosyltransferase family 2 protein [Fimbriimonadaceae bacterium]|nr:MAG: glycosyltransferase family 2 protein [Fimbriimonadaceae bacterium]